MENDTDHYSTSPRQVGDSEQELQQQLEQLQMAKQQVERQKRELSELKTRQEKFRKGQVDMGEKLRISLTEIHRSLEEFEAEKAQLQEIYACFEDHLSTIQHLDMNQWSPANMNIELNHALNLIEEAEMDYEEAMECMQNSSASNFESVTKPNKKHASNSDFKQQFQAGFAFNLPLILFGCIALVIWLSN